MRLLIASDVHGSPERATFLCRKAEDWKPDMVVFLGDMLYHGPRNPLPFGYKPRDVADILKDIHAPIVAVRGNCDAEVDMMLLPFTVEDTALLYVDHLRILCTHGQHLPPEPPFKGVEPGMVVLSGHTHVPVARTINGVHCWNPGSTTLPKQNFPPSYGLYEDGEFRVLTMDGQELMRHRPA
ncbi:MAG: phosphodiesterase [Desulfovibrionaceae bacterium]